MNNMIGMFKNQEGHIRTSRSHYCLYYLVCREPHIPEGDIEEQSQQQGHKLFEHSDHIVLARWHRGDKINMDIFENSDPISALYQSVESIICQNVTSRTTRRQSKLQEGHI